MTEDAAQELKDLLAQQHEHEKEALVSHLEVRFTQIWLWLIKCDNSPFIGLFLVTKQLVTGIAKGAYWLHQPDDLPCFSYYKY